VTAADKASSGARSALMGCRVAPEFRANTYTIGDQSQFFDPASVSFSNSGFVVVWPSKGQDGRSWGVFGQRFDPEGAPLGAEFQVNTTTAFYQDLPDVAAAADGRFVVVWRGDSPGSWDIFGQRYDPAGNRIGGEFVLNTYTTGFQSVPDVADANGNFVAVWSGPTGLVGQTFDAAGNRTGVEFQVNADTSGGPARVAAAPDGRFVVAWFDRADGSGGGVSAQRFTASGTKVGAELRVNSYTTGDQGLPSVAMDAHGRFTAVWDGANPLGFQVFARSFDAQGQAARPEFTVAVQKAVAFGYGPGGCTWATASRTCPARARSTASWRRCCTTA
jgi:large repetitive protein